MIYKVPYLDYLLTQEQVIREQDEHLLKFTLLQRLETMETRVQVCPDSQKSPSNYENDVMMHKAHNFEVVKGGNYTIIIKTDEIKARFSVLQYSMVFIIMLNIYLTLNILFRRKAQDIDIKDKVLC